MTIYEKLLAVQTELKAPKGQFNDFGKYKYRSCEDILEAAKPILAKHKALVYLTDAVKLIGQRYYIEATANFIDVESGEKLIVTASAREEESKKGMDGSQVTGASSSYARKYALNGLFDIDDTKDSDATNTGDNGQEKNQQPKGQQPKKQVYDTARKRLIAALKIKGINIEEYAAKHELNHDTPNSVYVELLANLKNEFPEQ